MTTQHTRTKLTVKARQPSLRDGEQMYKIDGLDLVYDYEDWGFTEDDARRLVACWNRLEKFTTEQIEDLGYDLFADVRPDFERAMRERDELLWALKAASNYIDVLGGDSKGHRQAFAKVEGGAV